MKPLLRTTALTLALAAVVLLGYRALRQYEAEALRAEIRALEAEMAARIAEREAMIERLSRSHRLAHLVVDHQVTSDDGTVEQTTCTLIELDDRGAELARQTFTVPGDVIFIDAWTAKFHPRHVAQGHLLYGRTLILLRRIYSEQMAPIDGIQIDLPGAIPAGYAVGEPARFEQALWDHFWSIASDPREAEAFGVRIAQGEVVYQRVQTGQIWSLTVDRAGGMNLAAVPADEADHRVDARSLDCRRAGAGRGGRTGGDRTGGGRTGGGRTGSLCDLVDGAAGRSVAAP